MADYRLYFHDDMGHIRSVKELRCADDAEATNVAEVLLSANAGELWELARCVKVFAADSIDLKTTSAALDRGQNELGNPDQ